MNAPTDPPIPDYQPEPAPLDYADAESWALAALPAPDAAAEVERLKSELQAVTKKYREQHEQDTRDLINSAELLSIRTASMRRAEGRLLQCVRALRALCTHLENQPITSLTYFGGEKFAKAFREAAEVLKLFKYVE